MLVSINLLHALGLMAWLCPGALDSSIAAPDSAIGVLAESAASSAGIEAPPVVEGEWYLLFNVYCSGRTYHVYDLNGTNSYAIGHQDPGESFVFDGSIPGSNSWDALDFAFSLCNQV